MPTYDFAEGQGYVQIFIPSSIGFIPSESLYPIGIGPRKVEVADVSGNLKAGYPGLSSDVLDVLVQQPDGNFILNVINDPKKESWEYPNSVASADFNGDGLNDVAVQIGNRPSSVIVYYQDAMGELDPGIDLPWPSFPYAMTIMGNSMIAGDIHRR